MKNNYVELPRTYNPILLYLKPTETQKIKLFCWLNRNNSRTSVKTKMNYTVLPIGKLLSKSRENVNDCLAMLGYKEKNITCTREVK